MAVKQQERDPLASPIDTRNDDRRSRTWTPGRLAIVTSAAFVSAAVLTAASTGYIQQRHLARQLIAQNHELRGRMESSLAALRSQLADLDDMAAKAAAGERRLRTVARERDQALGAVHDLEQEIEARALSLKKAVDRRDSLAGQLSQTEARLIEISGQRDASQRNEASLRWRLASIQTQLERLGARQAFAQSWLEGWVLGNLETLEQLVAGTGVDVETLVARAASAESGQGGPYEAMVDEAPEDARLDDAVADRLMRLSALQKLASSLPLAAPLDQFQITSGFGKRQDPFTKTWAFHGGLDMGAPRGSKALATAPGTVVTAGPSGPYGNMVEIDHGMGVATRYGHLKSVLVAVGDHVGFRQPVGVIGTTGRSTARHLHYEIRVDGAPHDPSRFLDAGRYLVAIFHLGQMTAKGPGEQG